MLIGWRGPQFVQLYFIFPNTHVNQNSIQSASMWSLIFSNPGTGSLGDRVGEDVLNALQRKPTDICAQILVELVLDQLIWPIPTDLEVKSHNGDSMLEAAQHKQSWTTSPQNFLVYVKWHESFRDDIEVAGRGREEVRWKAWILWAHEIKTDGYSNSTPRAWEIRYVSVSLLIVGTSRRWIWLLGLRALLPWHPDGNWQAAYCVAPTWAYIDVQAYY